MKLIDIVEIIDTAERYYQDADIKLSVQGATPIDISSAELEIIYDINNNIESATIKFNI